jgi:uncharacterized protein
LRRNHRFPPTRDDARPLPAYSEDKLAQLKKEYEFAAKEPSNLRYGYVRAG